MTLALSDDVRDLLTLHLVTGIGPRLTAALLERFGSAGTALGASAAELLEVPQIGQRLADAITRAAASGETDRELARLTQHNVHLLAFGTPDYPPQMIGIPDLPHVLYIRGQIKPEDANAVALVGSRHCTPYGRRMAEKLASGLARAGVVTVSGLARGIDGVAHRAALDAGGRTLAVLAGGLSSIYPPEHVGLAKDVAAAGALITESSMEQEPMAGLFPARNRIISGLSRLVVIVEAAEKSGALLTASHAADQGRTVLAVPGPADSAASGGCHDLLRKGAVLCRGVDDVLEELHGVSAMYQAAKNAPPEPAAPAGPPPGLDDTQRRVWDFLSGQVRTVDEMAQQLGLSVPVLSTTLMMLEMKKAVRRLPGNRYERV
jgi:DNA processing protein